MSETLVLGNLLHTLLNKTIDKEIADKYDKLFNENTEYTHRFTYHVLKNFSDFLAFLRDAGPQYIKINRIESIQLDFINYIFLVKKSYYVEEDFFEDFLKNQGFEKSNRNTNVYIYRDIVIKKILIEHIDEEKKINICSYVIYFRTSKRKKCLFEPHSFEQFRNIIQTLKTIIGN